MRGTARYLRAVLPLGLLALPAAALGRRTRLAAILSLLLLAASALAPAARANSGSFMYGSIDWYYGSTAGSADLAYTEFGSKPLGVDVKTWLKWSYQWGTNPNDWTHQAYFSVTNDIAQRSYAGTAYSVVSDHRGRAGWLWNIVHILQPGFDPVVVLRARIMRGEPRMIRKTGLA